MRTFKFALCGVVAVAGLLAAVRSLPADTVDLWLIYDVRPWINWDGRQPGPPVGEGWRVERTPPRYDAE